MGIETENSAVDATHQSKMRTWAGAFLTATAEQLHNHLPRLHPDHISYLGTLLTVGGGIIAASGQEKPQSETSQFSILGLSALVLGQSMDAIDGTYARFLISKGYDIDSKRGGRIDVLNDRLQEGGLAFYRAFAAEQRGDVRGRRAALFNAATLTLSSVARAYAESKGVSVPEDGKRWIHFWGSRAGRVILQTVITVIPVYRGNDIQTILDTLMGVANLINAYDRFGAAGLVVPSLSEEKRVEAKARLDMLAKVTVLAATMAASLDAYFEQAIREHST